MFIIFFSSSYYKLVFNSFTEKESYIAKTRMKVSARANAHTENVTDLTAPIRIIASLSLSLFLSLSGPRPKWKTEQKSKSKISYREIECH